MVGASPKASSLKLWASGVPLVSVLVESLQTRCKQGFRAWDLGDLGCALQPLLKNRFRGFRALPAVVPSDSYLDMGSKPP